MGHDQDRAWIAAQVAFQPSSRLGVEMVRRLVEKQELRLFEKELAKRDATTLAA
jgi:hypothetical protein